MSTSDIPFSQIMAAATFIVALFGLYRLLVDTKDATIVNLKEKIALLEKQLEVARESSPDVLVSALSKRVDNSNAEMARMNTEIERLSATVKVLEEENAEQKETLITGSAQLEEIAESWKEALKGIST